jgi:ribosome-associated protein
MDEQEQDTPQRVSKTRRKQEMQARQEVGEALVRLSDARLAELELPDRLREAVIEARRTPKFGALRRQLQYIGRLMRDVDVVAIEARLEAWNGQSREASAYLHVLERWRERLLASDAALAELAQAYPGHDLQRVRTLVRNARREQALNRARVNFRELFQALKSIVPERADRTA